MKGALRVACFVTGLVFLASAQGCSVSINTDLTDPQPLILKPNYNLYGTEAYYLPSDGTDQINFQSGDIVDFNCPGGTVKLAGADTKLSAIRGTCTADGNFDFATRLGYASTLFSEVTCSKHTVHEARYTGESCLGKYLQGEIGFQLSDGRFLREIEICYDDVEQHTRYSAYNLSKSIGGYQVGYPRPSFVEGNGFYNLNGLKLDNLYTRNTQRSVINSLLGLDPTSYDVISESNDYYLARGHLTAKADFVYGSQHRLTFYFINAAPQWQTFNGGNWQSLEDSVQKFGAKRPNDLLVYTGSYGKATLPHKGTGEEVELVLYRASSGQIGIPVPALYWKVVYDPISREGVAFVGVNNPYIDDPVAAGLQVCKDVCDQVTFVTWKPNDIKSGFGYCCTVDDLRSAIPDVPPLKVDSLFK